MRLMDTRNVRLRISTDLLAEIDGWLGYGNSRHAWILDAIREKADRERPGRTASRESADRILADPVRRAQIIEALDHMPL